MSLYQRRECVSTARWPAAAITSLVSCSCKKPGLVFHKCISYLLVCDIFLRGEPMKYPVCGMDVDEKKTITTQVSLKPRDQDELLRVLGRATALLGK